VTQENIRNQLDGGMVGNVVQARDIGGDLHLHMAASPDPALPVPAQLPAGVLLADRHPQQAALTRLLPSHTTTTTRVAMITGPAGIGKTALAVAFANTVRDRFPDGQLYVCLRGDIPAWAVPGMWLRAVGVPSERVPVRLAEQEALLRSRTADKRLLVVIDSAQDADAVLRLIPNSRTCLVLVTCRQPLPDVVVAANATVLPLPPLSYQDSVAVLAVSDARAHDDPDGLTRLVAHGGGRPLTLALLKAHLAIHPATRLSDLADRLAPTACGSDREATDPTADNAWERVMSVFEKDLPPRVARTARLTALHGGPHITVQIAAAAAGIEPAEALAHLAKLEDAGHLARDGVRFLFDTSVRDYYRRLSDTLDTPADRAAVLRRIVVALYEQTAPYDFALNPRRPRYGYAAPTPRSLPTCSPAEAFAYFDTEWPNLVAALLAVAAFGLDSALWMLVEALWTYIHRQRKVTAVIEILELGVAAAKAARHLQAEGRELCQLTQALLVAGRTEEAARCADAAVEVAQRSGDQALLASALSARGKVAETQGDLAGAEICYARAAEADERANNPRGAALHLRRRAQLLVRMGRYAEALTIFDDAEGRMMAHGGRVDVARVRTFFGEALIRVEDFGRAESMLAQALEVALASGTDRYVADVQLVRGLLAAHIGDPDAGVDLVRRARTVYVEGGDQREVNRADLVLAEIEVLR